MSGCGGGREELVDRGKVVLEGMAERFSVFVERKHIQDATKDCIDDVETVA